MSLYALGDMHLSVLGTHRIEDNGDASWKRLWKNHETKIEKYWHKMVKPTDTVVITGDHCWGHSIEEAAPDLAFIEALPGRKILLRGNHDMFWDAKKTNRLNELYKGRLEFLQNNYYVYEDYALVGTKGYTFEGPFYVDRYGRIIDWDEAKKVHAEKLVERELVRLQQSFALASAAGYKKFVMFLHYPPTNVLEKDSPFTRIAEQYQVSHVVYSHCHGSSRYNDSIRGVYHGIPYHLVSGDFLDFRPEKILS